MNHTQPSPDELAAEVARVAAELEQPEVPVVDDDQPGTPDPVTPPVDETPEVPADTLEIPTVDETPQIEQSDDYRKKFAESSREAQILHARNKEMADAIMQAGLLTPPTDEDMKTAYSDWDDMTVTEQRLARQATLNDQRFAIISETAQKGKDVEAWVAKVDEFMDDPKTFIATPDLEGKQAEFKLFASKPTRRGVDFDILVKSFLWEEAQHAPAPKKGKMFETGTGGPNDAPKAKSDKISLTEAATLMRTDYKKYKELLQAGRIDTTL